MEFGGGFLGEAASVPAVAAEGFVFLPGQVSGVGVMGPSAG